MGSRDFCKVQNDNLSAGTIQFKLLPRPTERGRKWSSRPFLFQAGDIIKRCKGIQVVGRKKIEFSKINKTCECHFIKNRLGQLRGRKRLMPSRLIFQACCSGTHFPLCVPCFRLLTTWEHLLCLGLSYFSHQPTPSSPTWTQSTRNPLSTAELLQEILGDFYKDLRDGVECVTKPSIFFAPRHQLRNP